MRALTLPRSITEGERRLAVALLCMALFGAAIGLMVAARLGHGGIVTEGMGPYDLWIVLSGACGGAAGLWFMRHRMGLPGLHGAARAVGGVIGVSLLGPVIGGTLALPLYGTMFGPFTLAVMLAGAPLLGGFWFFTLAMIHVLLRDWQDERDSIFRPLARPVAGLSLRRGSSG